jgi:uncharacterized protein (TIGR03000 family)
MFGPRSTLPWAATLATTALLLASRPAPAQGPSGYYYETFHYGYNPGYYARRYPAPPAGYGSGYAKTAAGPVTAGWLLYAAPPSASGSGGAAQSLVISGARRAEAADLAAQLELRVPAQAQVWIDGVPTRQTRAVRLFVLPALTAGKEFSYEVRVAWKEGDTEKVEKRDLAVRAGDRLSESFPAAAGGE